jgi:cell shape-determining protein MreC
MSPKRWFWSLLAVAACWSFAGWRLDSDKEHPGVMRSVQNGTGGAADVALAPPRFLAARIQQVIAGVLRGGASQNTDTLEQLRDKNTALEDENVQLKAMVLEARARLLALGQLQQQFQIQPQNVLIATVSGYSPGSGASTLKLDKGSSSGVKVGAPVLAPFERICLLGRVSSVTPITSEATLASDPGDKGMLVQIVRPQHAPFGQPGGIYQDLIVTSQPYLMKGLGNNLMEINGINKSDAEPLQGDLVCLTDGQQWWQNVQHMVVGQVENVGTQQNNSLRYRITVSPRVPIVTQRTVMIVLQE